MDSEKIGYLIKKIRIENNLTQQEFANKYGVTYQAVSKWENGKNLPDIMLLKEICDDYNVSIDGLLDGNNKTVNKKNYFIIVIVIILFLVGLIVIFNHRKSYKFKTITSNCSEFKITGSVAYDKTKSSIYISNVSYCGGEDNKVYEKIDCTLYETSNGINKKIKECPMIGENINLDDYLRDVSIIIDDYNQTCNNMDDNTLFLEIYANEKDNKIVTYKVPLLLNESCKN